MKKIVLIFFILLLTFSYTFGDSHFSTQSHQAQVNKIVPIPNKSNTDNSYFSAGEDGFLIKWTDDNQGEHYQISDVGIKLIAISPNGNDVAVYESDGGSVNKVSVWDWKTLSRKYQKKFSDSITSLAFSSKGTYLIIGTATVDGAIFVKTQGWTTVDKIKTNTSIVNYIQTSDTEKTVVFYSPAGNLSYYNLQTGQLKQKFNIVQGLSQPVLYNNNIFFAGVKDNQIYIINAYKGTSVASIPALNPIILSNSRDFNLYYLEYDGRNTYELKMLENLDNQTVSNPRIVKTLKGPRGDASIIAGTKQYGELCFGSRSGEIYKLTSEASLQTENLTALTENSYSKIYGMCPADKDFYFLTGKSIFKSSYDSGKIVNIATTEGQTQILNYNDNNVILWTKASRKPVSITDLDKNVTKELFTPKSNIQTLKVAQIKGHDYLIEIESNTIVNIYDFETETLKEVYSGTGIQDAVLANNGYLYIAKSAATNPAVPMLCVNINTLETVPLAVKGNVAYALSTDGVMIYGINLISDDNGRNTYVFSFNTETKQVTNILKFADEDSEAFTYLCGANLFTNIGKNKVYCYNLTSKKRFSYNRSASIPQSICENGKHVVILNNNGSISWCNNNNSSLLADWYLTTDEQWFEF